MANQNITKKYVTLYYADWCGHCKTFKPEWFKFKAVYNKIKQEIKDKYNIELILNEYENDIDPQKAIEADVKGFPTIKIKYNDKTDDYIGPRTAVALFKKLIPNSNEDEIISWLGNLDSSSGLLYGEVSLSHDGKSKTSISLFQMGGINGIRNYGIKATDPKILYANSYRKLCKYKKKCQQLNLI